MIARTARANAAAFARLALPTVLLLATACTPPARGRDSTRVTVSATAEARRAPDIATLTTGVVTQATDARTAMRPNAQRMQAVVGAIHAAGIATKDVQTSGVSLNPDYHYAADRAPRIKGYAASNTVAVTVRDIARLGTILDALVAVGANEVHGPMFDIADKDALLDEARGKALAKARARAEQYAKRLDLRVVRVVRVDETGGPGMPGPLLARAMVTGQAAAADASAPIAPGENAVQLVLSVVFELVP